MKRKTAFILALIMVLCVVFSACGSTTPKEPQKPAVTKESLIGTYKEKASQLKGTSYTLAMDAKLGISMMGQSQNMEMSGEVKVAGSADAAHISGTVAVNAGGNKNEQSFESYSVKSGDGFDVYTNLNGKWYKTKAQVKINGDVQALLALQDASSMKMTETDKEYIVEGTVPIADLMDAIKNYISTEDIAGSNMDLGSLDFKGVEPAKTTYHFDKTTQQATAVDIDMADCMKSLMDQLMKMASGLSGQIGGGEGSGIDLSSLLKFEVEKFTMSVKDIVFDSSIKIELPDAAKNAAEMPSDILANIPAGYKEFEVDEMRLYLPSGFTEQQAQGYTKAFADATNLVLVLKEEKSAFGGYANSMEDYVQLVVKANEARGITEAQYENGRPVFEYEYNSDTSSYKYYTSLYESEDAYWIVQFATETKNYDKLRASFVNMADIVTFEE